jgi:nucleotide-binding universal stress UspA family protein
MNHPVDESDFKLDSLQRLEKHLFVHAEGKMATFLEKVKERVPMADGKIVSGEAADAILAYARDHGADLIIISTHGAQGIEKVLLGSVADRVIKGASCPVLVFNPFITEARGYDVCKPLNACLPSPAV